MSDPKNVSVRDAFGDDMVLVNRLEKLGVTTLGELIELEPEQLEDTRMLGPKRLNMVSEVLQRHGLVYESPAGPRRILGGVLIQHAHNASVFDLWPDLIRTHKGVWRAHVEKKFGWLSPDRLQSVTDEELSEYLTGESIRSIRLNCQALR
jgi:hypothetical protein